MRLGFPAGHLITILRRNQWLPEPQKVLLQRELKADVQQVYQAFTNATVLREWFCDIATVSPNSGGRIYMAWDDGYYTSGYYLTLKEYQRGCLHLVWPR